MEADRQQTGFSAEYTRFWELRGKGTSIFDGGTRPNTKDELERAQERTSTILELFQDPDFGSIRTNLLALTTQLMREGKLTEEQHMEIVSTFETLTSGETTEEFLTRIEV